MINAILWYPCFYTLSLRKQGFIFFKKYVITTIDTYEELKVK